jgi:hypothetical protein
LSRRGDAVLGAIQITYVKNIEKINKREDQTEPFETSPSTNFPPDERSMKGNDW